MIGYVSEIDGVLVITVGSPPSSAAPRKTKMPPFEEFIDEETGERHTAEQCFNSDEWQHVVHDADGGKTIYGGGPCGPLYVDKFGNI